MSKTSNKDQQLAALRSLLADKESQLTKLQQLAGAAQASSAAQSQKLAENNSSLARTNARLVTQVDRLTKQCTQLQHLCSGQQAIAKAKQAELSSEVESLKNLLQESMAERRSLSAQLTSKQEVINYLEWRLLQIQHMCASTLTGNTGSRVLPSPRTSISPLLRVPGNKLHAGGQTHLHDFPIFADRNLSQSIGVAETPQAPSSTQRGRSNGIDGEVQELALENGENKENAGIQSTVPSFNQRSVRFSGIDTVRESPVGTHQPRTPLADITPYALASGGDHLRPQPEGAFQTPTTSHVHFLSMNESISTPPETIHEVGNSMPRVEETDSAGSQSLPRITASQVTNHTPSLTPASEGEGETAESDAETSCTIDNTTDQTEQQFDCCSPKKEQHSKDGDSSGDSLPHPEPCLSVRSSSRRKNRVSYTLPSVRSKLRQGDPFTFGDSNTMTGTQKTPASRNRRKSRDRKSHQQSPDESSSSQQP